MGTKLGDVNAFVCVKETTIAAATGRGPSGACGTDAGVSREEEAGVK